MQIDVQLLFLKMLEQRSSRSVDNTLGHTCGARGIHNVKRMIKRQILKIDLRCIRFKIGNQLGAGMGR